MLSWEVVSRPFLFPQQYVYDKKVYKSWSIKPIESGI